jgi:transcription initiation factor TFIIIB Brf1 subunit/transcription initiation factor TFIIB
MEARKQKSLDADLRDLLLPQDIKDCANRVYAKMEVGTRRKQRRKWLVFVCLYNAHRELEIAVDPIALGEKLGLTKGELMKAVSAFSPARTGYTPPKEQNIFTFIALYCKELGISTDSQPSVRKLVESILLKDRAYYDYTPQYVVLAAIKYFLTVNGVDASCVDEKYPHCSGYVDNIYKKIAETDNS